MNARGLRLLSETLTQMGFESIPSEANFVTTPLENADAAQRLTLELLRRGVIIRPLAAFGLPHCVRISTGTDEDNRMLIDALEQIQSTEVLCRK